MRTEWRVTWDGRMYLVTLAADQPCSRCGAYCTDDDECHMALDGVEPGLWRNPERNAS
jgi:hypothetical protein